MKIAIMKIGANITFSSNNKSAANADILYALRTIDPHRHNCTIITHRTRNTVIPKPLHFEELQELNSLDAWDIILVFNGSINFFGGKEDIGIIKMYKLLSQTKTPIAYVNTDGQLPFKQLWPSIWKRDWAQKYSEDEFYINQDNVHYITQGRDVVKIAKLTQSKPDNIVPLSITHFNWEQTILANHQKHFKFEPKPFKNRDYTLIFGGATRNTHKRKLIEKYYNSGLMPTLLFGNLRGVQTNEATLHSKISYQDFLRKMQLGKTTVIIADEFYNNNFFTLRMYESILAGCLVFIDNQLDTNKDFYRNVNIHTDSLYVNKPHDIFEYFNEGINEEGIENLAKHIRKEILEDYDLPRENKRLIEIFQSIT